MPFLSFINEKQLTKTKQQVHLFLSTKQTNEASNVRNFIHSPSFPQSLPDSQHTFAIITVHLFALDCMFPISFSLTLFCSCVCSVWTTPLSDNLPLHFFTLLFPVGISSGASSSQMSTHLLNYLYLLFSVGRCSLLLLKHTASWIHAYLFPHTFSISFFLF